MPGKPKPRPNNFGSIYDHQGIKPEGPSNTIIDYSVFNSNKEGKGTSVRTGILVVGLFTCLIFTGGWFTWKAIPDQMKNYTLDMIPFIERVKKPIDAYQVRKETPGPDMTMPEYVVKTRPMSRLEVHQRISSSLRGPLYDVRARLNDGAAVRIMTNLKMRPIPKVHVSDIHLKSTVLMAVRVVAAKYTSEEFYNKDQQEMKLEILAEIKAMSSDWIQNLEMTSFEVTFDAKTEDLFARRRRAKAELERAQQRKKIEILEAEAQIERAKIHKRIVEEEMKVREFELKRKLEIERSKQLYQAETKRLVDEILDNKKTDADSNNQESDVNINNN